MMDTFDAMRAGIALALAVYAGAGIVGGLVALRHGNRSERIRGDD